MTPEQVRAFMLDGSRTGKLATVRADGSPHVVPVWFTFDDEGRVVFLTGKGSLKARNMARDPRVAIAVDDEAMPFAWARVDGSAELTADSDELFHWAVESCRRCVGDDRAEEFGRRNAVPEELLVRVTPTRMLGATGVAD
jgi:PPOX class probable F420-dependent enzyme